MLSPTPGLALGVVVLLSLNFLLARGAQVSLRTIFLLGLASRLILLCVENYLSTDIYRYLWEGQLLRNGLNPYKLTPDATSLLPLHTEYWSKIDHKHLSAIYPPLAQTLLALIAYTETTWRFFLVTLDCATFFVLIKILKRLGRPLTDISWYWLLPVSIIEIAWSGHLEGVLVFLFSLVWLVQLREEAKAPLVVGMLLGLAALVKYNALFLAPFIAAYYLRKGLKKGLLFSSSCLIIFLLGCTPFLDSSFSIFSSLTVYLEHWRFNDSLLHLAGYVFDVNWHDSRSIAPIKNTLLCGWIALAFWISIKSHTLSKSAVLLFFSYLLFSSVVHPWYVLWFAPFLVVYRGYAAGLLCLLVPLSYLTGVDRGSLPLAAKLLEYLPVYLLLLFEIAQQRRKPRSVS